ncbi:2-oxoglutarate (2OG) and Fe(II)-dependent oxygenase superfamily protein [Rhynchospora pubera]|uniref:procollagen-proline 4-dioxygenase n=1 Tax=Rhynchospora pubera TaxID=906938 RepID=A0AAV8CYD5_9POAL|nr:2-oxoglutarate (2OG) and Fe(II)-dependent oxygenase superfamily protein [Rhynchospora pubera]
MDFRWVFLFFALLSITAIPSFYFPRKKVQAPGSFDPASVVTLSWKPRIFLYKGFLSHEECDHIIKLARSKLKKSMVVDNESGKSVMSQVRTSSGMFLDKRQDEVISRIEKRIASWTLLPEENAESIQVLRYDLTEKYDAHFDYFHDKYNQVRGGHRYATLLMYLSDVEMGGETVFPDAEGWESQPKDDTFSDCAKRGLAVKPVKGDAVLFYSIHPDGTLDPKSLHASCPVIKGEKWSAPKWIHVRSFDTVEASPLEKPIEVSATSYPESSSATEKCTSESENCE